MVIFAARQNLANLNVGNIKSVVKFANFFKSANFFLDAL